VTKNSTTGLFERLLKTLFSLELDYQLNRDKESHLKSLCQALFSYREWIDCTVFSHLFKGIVSRVCQLRPLVYSFGPNNMPRISFKLVQSRIKKIYDASNRGPLDVKWRELDFTFLLKSVIKFVTLSKLIAVCTSRIANAKIGVLRTAKARCLNLRAECH
jgi:hypothetical protein